MAATNEALTKIHTVVWDVDGPIRYSREALNEAHNKAVESLLGRRLTPEERFKPEETWKLGLPGLVNAQAMVQAVWAIKIKEIKEGLAYSRRAKTYSIDTILSLDDPVKTIKAIQARYRISDKKLERAVYKWRTTLRDEALGTKAPLSEKAKDAIMRLHELGVKQAIATNADEKTAREYLQKHGIPQHVIAVIVGKESFEDAQTKTTYPKPHPYTLFKALHDLHHEEKFPNASSLNNPNSPETYRHLAELAKGTAFIGDTLDDHEAARNAGFYSVAITSGMGREQDLRKAGIDFISANALEFAQHLEKHGCKVKRRPHAKQS